MKRLCTSTNTRPYPYLFILMSLLYLQQSCSGSGEQQVTEEQEQQLEQQEVVFSGNPILPGNFADPCILVHQDTFYIYATTGSEATVWYSPDFTDWKLTRLNWPTSMGKPDIWAPAVTQGTDGRFYLYTSTDHNIYAGVADHPKGPFTNILGGDSIFIKNRQWWEKMHSIDADCFVDDDGQAYLYWGSGFDFKDGICAVGRLNKDMVSFKEEPKLITPNEYFEGPHMMKRNGIYYLMYSDSLYYDSTYKVRYATSNSPMGPFTEGRNSPILKSTPDGKVTGPGHHYTLKRGDQYYIVYHAHALPEAKPGGDLIRQVFIDKLAFEDDGTIKPVVATDRGVPLDFVNTANIRQPVQPVATEASATVGPALGAQKAFDGDYGTLWAAPKATSPVWLQADFGKSISIKEIQPVFDQVMGDYQYRIEHSAEGTNWQLYAEGNNAQAAVWPVSHRKEADARYVRISILSQSPNLTRTGLWELKVFDE
ncbi:family 43 glycosylhydrolase [Cesiribacter sp. SM1]|uniref:family 43 glycosylhydrolase n=1 Tax=Cesiribacter sp. SM1 TaxID=2861196 RepID=UPI001CD1F027|nr:family 43 glycosylhydrolase [Cesiribacter sp. SM1]